MNVSALARVALATLAICSSLPAQDSTAQVETAAEKNTDRLTLKQYLDLEDVQDPQLSPNGKSIIYTRRWVCLLYTSPSPRDS